MSSDIEIDTERVAAVHAALAGPQKVWLVWWEYESEPGYGCWLCSTKEKAIASLRAALMTNAGDMIGDGAYESFEDYIDEVEKVLTAVAAVPNNKGYFDGCNYWLQQREIDD